MVDDIRLFLIERARLRVPAPVAYDTIMQQIGLDHRVPQDRDRLSEELVEISRFEHSKHRPMLSSLAMYAGNERVGFGFYNLAQELGYGNAKELEGGCFRKEMQDKCHEFWANDGNYKRFLNDTSDDVVVAESLTREPESEKTERMTKLQRATPDELLHSQILTVESLIRVLEQKGIVKKNELLAEVAKIKQELKKKRRNN